MAPPAEMPPAADLETLFGPDGRLSRSHPNYEPRPGQRQMAQAVSQALESGRHLLVEAGTGTGKTLAYLVPAALSGLKVVVSTGTKTLQDQIVERDIPFIREGLGIPVTATAMKGRENYLCLRRWAEFEREPLIHTLEEAEPFGEVRSWSRRTDIGDRAEVPGLPDEARFWRAINARGDTCTGSRCEQYDDCFLTRLKRRAVEAQIVVVNHHLFFADLALRRDAYGRILPDHDRVIFDEAHLLEDVATLYFGLSLSSFRVEELAADAERLLLSPPGAGGARRGFEREAEGGAGRAGAGRRRSRARERRAGRAGSTSGRVREVETLRQSAALFFAYFLADERGRGPGRFRFRPAQMGPGLGVAHERLSAALDALVAAAVPRSSTSEQAMLIERRAAEITATLREILASDEATTVTWAETRGRGVFLGASPVDVSCHLSELLFDRTSGIVLTSATLSVRDEFTFARQRLGVGEADELLVPSPFDHERQAVLYLPARMPDPREDAFLARLVEEVLDLIEITRGRAFLLFTSFANLHRVREALDGRLDFPILTQGEGSKGALLDRFRRTDGAVLLGTSSFWHGVDVPGEALSLVVVDRLPFDVPGDPLVAARIERIQRQGGNAFADYQLPAAVLELKQGLGRLIRSSSDRGVLAVLDGRLRTRSYGRVFLESLPPFPVVDSLAEVRRFFRQPARAAGGAGGRGA